MKADGSDDRAISLSIESDTRPASDSDRPSSGGYGISTGRESPELARQREVESSIARLLSGRRRHALVAKRTIDFVGSLIGLILGAPVFLLIALVILVIDGWPIFFPWDVIGKDGRPFRGWKFRTMVRDADSQRVDLAAHNEMRGPVFKMRDDPRVTRLGAKLRRFSLDELPQLWSVLKGDMSLVGPRPLGPEEYAQATPYQRQKLAVVPGITCLWQVMGRSEIADFDEWVALDLEYIERWSNWMDLHIILRTVPAVLLRKGAW